MTHDDSNIKFPNLHEKAVKNFLNYFQIMLILNGYLGSIYNVLQPYIESSFHLSHFEIGFVSGVYFYVAVLLLIPGGLLLDRVNPKKVVLTTLAISIVGVLLNVYANGLALLVISKVLMGIGGAFCFIGTVRIVVNWAQQHHLALSLGIVTTMGFLGGLFVQSPLMFAIHHFGWRNALIIYAGIGILIFLLIASVIKVSPRNAVQHKPYSSTHLLASLFRIFTKRQNTACGIYTSLMTLTLYLLGAIWGVAYLKATRHFSEAQSALFVVCCSSGQLLVRQ